MTAEILVFEPATPETFDARRYLLANKDLILAFGDDPGAATGHYQTYGRNENRRQLTESFVDSQREKFGRFRMILPASDAARFPVSFGSHLYQISDYQGESQNEMCGVWLNELTDNPNLLYADIGAGLRRIVFLNCVYVEVYPSLTADVLVDPECKLPFIDNSLDGIGCFAVLEHVDRPWEMAAEFARVVKPGGKIFIDWPFLQPVHGAPSHYYNATREGLRTLFADKFEIDQLYTGAWQGPSYTVTWILKELLANIKNDAVRAEVARTTVADLSRLPPESEAWRTILGTLDDHAISTLSCGNFLVAVKR